MAWHAARGDEVWVCILTDGVTSRHDRVQLRADCARRACDTLDVEKLVLVDEAERLAAAPRTADHYERVLLHERVGLDLAYLDQRTFTSDLVLLVRRAAAILRALTQRPRPISAKPWGQQA